MSYVCCDTLIQRYFYNYHQFTNSVRIISVRFIKALRTDEGEIDLICCYHDAHR